MALDWIETGCGDCGKSAEGVENRETSNRVNNAARTLSAVNTSLPVLRQDVADVARVVRELRDTMCELFARLPDPSAAVDIPPVPEQAPAVEQPEHEQDRCSGPGFPQQLDTDAATAAPEGEDGDADRTRDGDLIQVDAAHRQAATETVANALADEEGDSAHSGLSASPERPRRARHRARQGGRPSAPCTWSATATCGTSSRNAPPTSPHFRAPATPAEESHDRLRIALSGRSVVGVLIAMKGIRPEVAEHGKDDGTWVLSGAVYKRLVHDLTTTSRHGTEPPERHFRRRHRRRSLTSVTR
ncbi:hypothetical protein ACIP6P_23055 [Streptomyces sp. NPDC088729]|uniref:hypothetical protein n=1 Tax=Streptomyces sp. NPDC088729 TaxID=3365876 RepID=UPI0037F76DB5